MSDRRTRTPDARRPYIPRDHGKNSGFVRYSTEQAVCMCFMLQLGGQFCDRVHRPRVDHFGFSKLSSSLTALFQYRTYID